MRRLLAAIALALAATLSHAQMAGGVMESQVQGVFNGTSITNTSMTANSVLFAGTGGLMSQDNGSFAYTTANGPRLAIGSGSTTLTGLLLGHGATSGTAGIWEQTYAATPSAANALLYTSGNGGVQLNTPAAGTLSLQIAGVTKASLSATAGGGLTVASGIATTAVSPLAVSQTWNAAGITFPGLTLTITDSASAAASLALSIKGGASGTTNLLSLDKSGNLTAGAGVSSPKLTLTTNTEPACDVNSAGAVIRVAGGAGVADTVRMCGKTAADSYTYATIATF